MCFLNNLLDHGFLLYCFSAHDASNGERGEPSLSAFFQEHSGDTKYACTFKRKVPPVKLEKLNVLLSIELIYVGDSLWRIRVLCLRPVKPVKCTIFKLCKQKGEKGKIDEVFAIFSPFPFQGGIDISLDAKER